jgi:hypothetical protein
LVREDFSLGATSNINTWKDVRGTGFAAEGGVLKQVGEQVNGGATNTGAAFSVETTTRNVAAQRPEARGGADTNDDFQIVLANDIGVMRNANGL